MANQGRTLKARIILAAILALLLTGTLFATVGTGLKIKIDASNPAPYFAARPQNATKGPKAIVGQDPTAPAKLQNVSAENGPADSEDGETNLPWNRSLFQPVPFPDKSGQPNEPVPGRIHQPGLFPVFYDGMGDPSGLTYTNAPQYVAAAASSAGT